MPPYPRVPLLLLIAAALLLTIASCGPPPPKEIELQALDIQWSPDVIDAQPGQTLRINLVNAGALDHDLVIKDLGVDVALSPGESAIIEVVVIEPGIYEYICSVPGHEEAGMVGTLVIGN